MVPTSFDNVPYARNQFLGDLIVTDGVFYYFPHTNVAAAKQQRREVAGFLIHSELIIDLTLILAREFIQLSRLLTRSTVDSSRLKEAGLWPSGCSSRELQQRLDAYMDSLKSQPPSPFAFEYSVPGPVRFPATGVKNLKIGLSKLTFDTEFDDHDFKIGFVRRRNLRDALWQAGFRA